MASYEFSILSPELVCPPNWSRLYEVQAAAESRIRLRFGPIVDDP